LMGRAIVYGGLTPLIRRFAPPSPARGEGEASPNGTFPLSLDGRLERAKSLPQWGKLSVQGPKGG
jgi:hypothetical protein